MIEVRGLHVSIGSHQACRDLSFALPAGKSLAILGRNGAGKSTLLATLAGLRNAERGDVFLQGRAIGAYGLRELARLRGYCAQQQHDAFESTVLETALVGRHPHLDRWSWESATDEAIGAEALSRVGLSGFAQRTVQTLSGGERQRLAIATLLVQQPQLYLLDEPLSHLDLNHAMATLALLRAEAARGKSLAAVLHEPNLARRHFDYALLLFGDGTWAYGASTEVLAADSLQRLYGHPLRTLQDNGEPWFIPE
jgi:iron complex transport system ATP-binding protein